MFRCPQCGFTLADVRNAMVCPNDACDNNDIYLRAHPQLAEDLRRLEEDLSLPTRQE